MGRLRRGSRGETVTDGFIRVHNHPKNALYHSRRLLRDELLRFAPDVKGRLLDFGCGAQPYRCLFPGATLYIPVDVPGSCHKLPNGTVLFDGTALPVRPNSLDWVLATEVLEHVPEPQLALTAVFESLRPGGRLALSVPFIHPVHEAPQDFRRWTQYGLARELAQAGFSSVQITPLGAWHTTVAHLLRVYAASLRAPRLLRWSAIRIVWVVSEVIVRSPISALDDMCIGWVVLAKKPTRCGPSL